MKAKNKTVIHKTTSFIVSLALMLGMVALPTRALTASAAEIGGTLPLGESGDNTRNQPAPPAAPLGLSISPFALGDYSPTDVTLINDMIANNGLSATANDPDIWTFVTWDTSTPKRIKVLNLQNKNLTGALIVTNIPTLTTLNCASNQLSSLSVANLPALTTLDCGFNQLTSLSVTDLPALENLYCSANQLSSLSVANLPALTTLDCGFNQLTSLSVTNIPALENLYCGTNQLSSLNVANLPALIRLNCSSNQLSSLSTENLPALTTLYCQSNQLSSLSVANLLALRWLHCNDNQLTSLSVTDLPALEMLICSDNQLSSLSVANLPALRKLSCDGNQLSSLSVANLPALEMLYCSNNQLTSLSVTDLPALEKLYYSNNQLTSLSVTDLPALKELHCDSNQLTTLSVANLPALTNLSCNNNQLSSLVLSGVPTLERLITNNNQISTLTLTGLTALTQLNCNNNQLASIDLTDQTVLGYLYCENNQLTALALSAQLITLRCRYNLMTNPSDVTGPTPTTSQYVPQQSGGQIGVTNIGGIPTRATATVDLTLLGSVFPTNATNQTIVWSIDRAGTTGATITGAGNVLSTTASGQVVLTATIANGVTAGVVYGQEVSIQVISYSTLTVTGGSGSGSYAASQIVTIVADTAPAGQLFYKWQLTPPAAFVAGHNNTMATSQIYMPAANTTATALYGYGITMQTDGNGAASADKSIAPAGETVALTATPASGYRFKEWQVVSGSVMVANNQFTMPAGAVTVKAVFELIPANHYTITVQSGGNGTASADKTSATAGETVTLTATPASGYRFKEWQVVSGSVMVANKQFTMPAGAVTVKAVFELIPANHYTITVQSGGNGTASADKTSATAGETVTLTATPDSGYRFKEWQVVSGGVTVANSQFTMPAGAVTVKAVFELIPANRHTITVQSGGNGTAIADKTSATAGETVTLTATPDSGYRFKEWQVVSGGVTVANSQFTMPAGAVTVKAVFELIPANHHTITVQTDGNGTASADKTSATAGETVTLTATPDSGYRFKEWQVVSGGVTVANSQFTMPAGAVTVNAIFEALPTIVIPPTGDGSGSGGSGSSGGGGGKPDTRPVASGTTTSKPLTAAEATTQFEAAMAAKPEGATALSIKIKNSTSVSKTVLAELASLAQKNGVTLTVHFDTVVGGKVVSRLSVNPATATGNLNVAIKENKTLAARFAKFYSNQLAVYTIPAAGSVAIKLPENLKPEDLVLYSYDSATNTYVQITNAKPWVDTNGYLHFDAQATGEIVISQGKLVKK